MKLFSIYPDYKARGELVRFPKKSLLGKICLSPFVSAEIDFFGNVRLCSCAAWMPSIVGNILEDSLFNIVNNAYSTQIKESIVNGDYEFCNEQTCGVMHSNQLNDVDTVQHIITSNQLPKEITLAGDLTCNLSCPSCRTKIISTADEDLQDMITVGNTLARNLFSEPTEQEINIMLSTSGEVFASPMMLSFIKSINKNDFPNVSLKIQTNGLLSKARWNRLNNIPVKKVTITIDATTKPVYEQLRRGGIWEDLLENLSFLQAKKKETGMQLHTRMVVQADNYHQMLDFYNLSKQYSADVVEYGRILPWGHLQDPKEFLLLDIADPKNINHDKFLKSFADIEHLTDVMTFGGLHC